MRTWDFEDTGGSLWLRVDGRRLADWMPDKQEDEDDEASLTRFVIDACNAYEQLPQPSPITVQGRDGTYFYDEATKQYVKEDSPEEARLRGLTTT